MRFKKRLFFASLAVLFGLICVVWNLLTNDRFEKRHSQSQSQSQHSTLSKGRKFLYTDESMIQNASTKYFHGENLENCAREIRSKSNEPNIQMLDVYNKLEINNTDGGVWKQGWDIQITRNRWNANNKLKIFLVAHSHNDPGWTKTFQHYYESQTRHIFNNMVTKLAEDARRKFIWAEVSFLSLWWAEADNDSKRKFKQFVDNGQIEIVSGGWVMPDEANSHYYSMIQQLTHGHQWLRQHLAYTPKRSWCIDPFGTSPTMPFLLQHFGLKSLVIQRTHYLVKKYLAKRKQLEFRWRQLWDYSGKYDFMTHMMPFYNYDVPHTCGPDPSVCCQFDFRRSLYSGMSCPWRKQPQMITNKNIRERAALLLDQYRKKAELYATNVLLVPLGDDFRYDIPQEWDQQYRNYKLLFDYMNNNGDLHVHAQFGTLNDYFEALEQEQAPSSFPSLSGDFFTYADRDDHYWSGYYTSRPYYKRMDRELVSYLRSAEMLHAISWKSSSLRYSNWLLSPYIISLLRQARANLSLFQHHDGITGTAKDHVVQDYAHKLEIGLNGTKHVMQQALNFLLLADKSSHVPQVHTVYFDLSESRKTAHIDEQKTRLKLDSITSRIRIVIFNSLTWRRNEILNVKVQNYHNVGIFDEHDQLVSYQISPFCETTDTASTSSTSNAAEMHCYTMYFDVDVAALSVKSLFLRYQTALSNENRLSVVTILNADDSKNQFVDARKFPRRRRAVRGDEFTLQNDALLVTFGRSGLMKTISMKHDNSDNSVISARVTFVKYGCRKGREMCGAYLFLPDGEAKPLDCGQPLIKIIEGKLISAVVTHCDYVIHVVKIYNCSGSEKYAIELQNLVDITKKHNFEIGMRISTSVENGQIFYTDLNGFQIIKRQYFSKLPLQANYYPMPSCIYIEDDVTRVTLVSAQPVGAASLRQGELEVMLDRRLNQDDNLGLGQGITDNRPTLHIFRLIVEKRAENCGNTRGTSAAGHLSVISYQALSTILYPLMLFVRRVRTSDNDQHVDVDVDERTLRTCFEMDESTKTASIDVHLVTMTSIPESASIGIILHRTDLDSCFVFDHEDYPFSRDPLNISAFVPLNDNDVVYKSSPSFLDHATKLNKQQYSQYSLCAMDLAAFYIANSSLQVA